HPSSQRCAFPELDVSQVDNIACLDGRRPKVQGRETLGGQPGVECALRDHARELARRGVTRKPSSGDGARRYRRARRILNLEGRPRRQIALRQGSDELSSCPKAKRLVALPGTGSADDAWSRQ